MNSIKTKILFILSLCFGINVFSQIELVPFTATQEKNENKLARRGVNSDTLSLPFFDNFIDLKQKDHWEENRGVFINNTLAANMPNVGFLTFDGIDGTGTAYQHATFLSEIDGIGDQITSCPLDLGKYTATDGVAMTFFWQIGSPFTDKHTPELERGDALILQFKDQNGAWRSVWPENERLNEIIAEEYGTDEAIIENVIVPESYLYEGFQFRFQSNSILTGNWDLFSVDNILLDSGIVSYGADTTFFESDDYAFSKVPESLFNGYVTMPFTHFTKASAEDVLRDSVGGSIYSLEESFINDKDSSISISHEGDIIYADVSKSLTGNVEFITRQEPKNFYWELDKDLLKPALDNILFFDEATIKTTLELITPDTDKTTDSASSYCHFNNYYARDDGTIEAGGGFIGPGEMVMAFDILDDDILTGIQVYFPKIGEDFQNTFITFKIYSSLEGIDGASSTELLYQQNDVVSYVEDSISLNNFLTINFTSEEILSPGRYYLGYESLTGAKILLGVDLNNNHEDKIFFRLFDDPWETAEIAGALAIRPVMGSVQVSTDGFQEKSAFKTFPNPAKDILHFSEEVSFYEVYSILGNLVLSGNDETTNVNTSSLEVGTYLLKAMTNNTLVTSKFVKD